MLLRSNYLTPYENLFGEMPRFDNMKVFGCLCVHHQCREINLPTKVESVYLWVILWAKG